MDNITASKQTASFGLSLAFCAILNALLVIAKERSKAVAHGMQRITGHHWITHVAVILFLFAFLGWCFTKLNDGEGPKIPVRRLTNVVLAGVVTSVVIVLGFYLIAD